MFRYPEKFYSDVRLEEVSETKILIKNGTTEDFKKRSYKAAFIRLYNGANWFYSSTDDVNLVQNELASLAQIAHGISERPDTAKIEKYNCKSEKNIGEFFLFKEKDVSQVEPRHKENLLKTYCDIISGNSYVKNSSGLYQDKRTTKTFLSSSGSEIVFDLQNCGVKLAFTLTKDDRILTETFTKNAPFWESISATDFELQNFLIKCENYVENVKPVKSGTYKIILSPFAAGIFAHESFGHKSESDFMLGDKEMAKEWQMGKKVGSDILSIVDDGNIHEAGFTPFDDEGTKAKKTFLIRDGVLSGRLHNVETALELDENPTGNARSISYMFEPIVRMTNTFILPGKTPKSDLFKNSGEAILIDTVKHGSGLSTFTLAPNRSYLVKNGEITEPVNISVITGNVFETLSLVEDLSEEFSIYSPTGGGCGKGDQYPLEVSFGGPYTTISKMNVQ
ncbi:TldD/PmbA family protein [candidate division WOR-3 bacterium]|nr:TldD/PmbA family protein [candidate division WOR-3 bacterium]